MLVLVGGDFIAELVSVGINLYVPSHSGKGRCNPKNLLVLRIGYDVLVGLRRLNMCDFNGLINLMNEVSSKHILPSLDATRVRIYFERILSIEVQILQTLGLSPYDRRSISAACAHVAVAFFSNILYNFKIDGKNEAVFPMLNCSIEFNRVELDGVVYTAKPSNICQMLWASAVSTRYYYAGSATTINVKEMLTEHSSYTNLGINSGAQAMMEWRADANEIVVQYVKDLSERNIIYHFDPARQLRCWSRARGRRKPVKTQIFVHSGTRM
jgi:hypothetical protein